jgi:hypothetical protein
MLIAELLSSDLILERDVGGNFLRSDRPSVVRGPQGLNMPPTRWMICWIVAATGQRGHGKPVFTSKEEADSFAADANRQFPGIRHWAEPVSG